MVSGISSTECETEAHLGICVAVPSGISPSQSVDPKSKSTMKGPIVFSIVMSFTTGEMQAEVLLLSYSRLSSCCCCTKYNPSKGLKQSQSSFIQGLVDIYQEEKNIVDLAKCCI